MRQYVLGTDPLIVEPYTDAERADLVARARLAMSDESRRRQRIVTLSANRAHRLHAAIRIAVRYVRLARVPVADARRTVGELTGQWVSLTAIRNLWNRLYPGEPRPQGQRGGSRVWQRRLNVTTRR